MNVEYKNEQDARLLAQAIRKHALRMVHRANASHIGSCLSMADLLAVLYGRILRIDPRHADAVDRDRFILSKGHGAAIYFAVLAECGFFAPAWLDTFCENESKLPGHATCNGLPGVEYSAGSLGHGLSIGCGMALAAKHEQRANRIFILMSDGECDEGSTWEAALFASHHRLDNVVVLIDYNKLQSFGRVKDVLNLEPLAAKWEAFGWCVREIDGHNLEQIETALRKVPFQTGLPSAVIAHTVKGKGVSYMENELAWHYKSPNAEQLAQALREIEAVP